MKWKQKQIKPAFNTRKKKTNSINLPFGMAASIIHSPAFNLFPPDADGGKQPTSLSFFQRVNLFWFYVRSLSWKAEMRLKLACFNSSASELNLYKPREEKRRQD